MLTDTELVQLRCELLDFITERVGDLVDAGQSDECAWLAAALEVDAGLRRVAPEVSLALEQRARRAGMTLQAIADVRGQRKQSVHRRVSTS